MCEHCPAEYHHHQHDPGRAPAAAPLAAPVAAPIPELIPIAAPIPETATVAAAPTPNQQAMDYVKSLGFAPDAAASIVFAQGVDAILAHQADAQAKAAAAAAVPQEATA